MTSRLFPLLRRALAGLGLLGAAAIHAQPAVPADAVLSLEALFAQRSPQVWVLQTGDAQGQLLAQGHAIAIGPDAAVTPCALLAKARTVNLLRGNVRYGATLAYPDVERGLCQLRVPQLPSPVLPIRAVETMGVGAPLYVIGAPRGRELTLGVGMLAGIRRSAAGEVEALQLGAALEPALVGAGLFDAQGRLAGVVGAASADAAAPPLAIPAAWIPELPARGQATLASAGPRMGTPTLIEYQLLDRLTGLRRSAVYRLDPDAGADGGLSFNNGGWVEKPDGGGIEVRSAVAGEFDLVMPPGGWVRPDYAQQPNWRVRYSSTLTAIRVNMDLNATVLGESRQTVAGREMNVVRIQYRGFTERYPTGGAVPGNYFGPYRAEVWYAPDLGRVVRLDVKTHGGIAGNAFQIDELLELRSIR
ncbi:S1 family peptidase [Pseudacidovorax sp. NFM-22]|uniref:S1 family peptidase n=1 Tax=Pseudacidovorax sp. NFM-22 TaxID=2744469 RepID=UPI001F391594|nr:serine protease [Pseudacidovorax sp. NFM-22]